MSSDQENDGIQTRCAHIGSRGKRDDRHNRSFITPIEQSSIFELGTSAEAESIFSGERPGYAYTRFGNPTVEVLAEAICELENGSGAMVTSSGNAAILCAVTSAMKRRSGNLVTHPDIYGGSCELLQILSDVYGLSVQFVDPSSPKQWLDAVSKAGAVILETPSNPLMRLVDIEATVASAKTNGAPVIVDNTVATPFNQRPFEYKADWVVHSTTKYLNGHSDMVGGCVIKREALTSEDRRIHKSLGGTVNAFESWLVLRGLRTFALRMQAHNLNGEKVVDWLRCKPEVKKVHYAGFAEGPQAEVYRKQMTHGGALLSFELAGGSEAATRFIDRLRLVVHAVSLGGMESLVTRPAMSSHRGMSPEARSLAGIAEGLVRLSVGVECVEDIIRDLDQALRD